MLLPLLLDLYGFHFIPPRRVRLSSVLPGLATHLIDRHQSSLDPANLTLMDGTLTSTSSPPSSQQASMVTRHRRLCDPGPVSKQPSVPKGTQACSRPANEANTLCKIPTEYTAHGEGEEEGGGDRLNQSQDASIAEAPRSMQVAAPTFRSHPP